MFNFTDEFDAHVVDPYVDAYASGETPNPCVECNRWMKFGRVLDRADQLGFDEIATGHHARVVDSPRGRAIARGADPAKDQSYVLYMLGAREIARTRLPIGEMTKADVRARAHELGLRTAEKRESMDVCFITRGGRSAFLGDRIGRKPGAIVDISGAHVGAHESVSNFTIGQRRGTGVAVGERTYVVEIAADTATVTVGPREALLRDRVQLRDLAFVAVRRRFTCSPRAARTARRSRPGSSATPCTSTRRSHVSRPARSWPATTVTCCSAVASRPREPATGPGSGDRDAPGAGRLHERAGSHRRHEHDVGRRRISAS